MSRGIPRTVRKGMPIQLSAAEHAQLQLLADAWGVSMAAAVRRLIREAPIPQELLPNHAKNK